MLYLFDNCRLDCARRELTRAGTIVALEPQVFDLLAFLVRHHARVISRDELIEEIWQGRIVSESTLASRISAARAAIGDSGEAQRLIKTVQRKGLRFVGEVVEAEVAASPPVSTAMVTVTSPRRGFPHRLVWPAAVLCIALMCAAFLGYGSDVWRRDAGKPPARLEFKDCDVCPEMVRLPAGEFMMGSAESQTGRLQTEGNLRRVTIKQPIAFGRFEVTVAQYAAFLSETGSSSGDTCHVVVRFDTDRDIKSAKPASFREQPGYEVTDGHPVGCVSWLDAQAYVAWLRRRTGKAYRLPTEAEWEYAVRAGTSSSYSFGDDEAQLCSYARFADFSTPFAWRGACRSTFTLGAVPVGSFKPNGFGLYDMHGNVWEFVEDCWTSDASEIPTDGSAFARSGQCEAAVVRGGSWAAGAVRLRSAARDRLLVNRRDQNMGFRVALPLDRAP